jgi:hypothetical protein
MAATPATPMPRLPRRIVSSLGHGAEKAPKPSPTQRYVTHTHTPARELTHCRPSRDLLAPGIRQTHGTGAALCPGSCGRDLPVPTAAAGRELCISPYYGGAQHP